ncbi:phage adaptor protein [Leisingera sp. NJS204]|uniref:phage adaptor protein n=1 Tax=Leisingera sp. NJS204 TaxID=2508307 RepID=UPI001013BBAE|nr:hypothetical protein [Leisingera sp. NJS204]QAX31311.1 hypothetical protein ETW24_19075 [Leisingera sp. NJS204]
MIADYPELIAEVSHRSGVSGVVNRAKMYVGMAERALSKRLRVADMETAATLTTDAQGRAALPADFEAVRMITVPPGVELAARPIASVQSKYAGRPGYAIQARELLSTVKETDHELAYYAALPSLEADNTNWLLEKESEIYLQAVLFQVYAGENELERAQATAGYLGALIDALADADLIQRHAHTRITYPAAPQ